MLLFRYKPTSFLSRCSGSGLLRNAINIKPCTKSPISTGRYISWSSHYISGENIEEELERIASLMITPDVGSESTVVAATTKSNEKYDFALLLISKEYAPRIINLAGGYIKAKLGIKNLVGTVVDGVTVPLTHGKSSTQGIYLLLGGNAESGKDKPLDNKDWEITPFYHYSSNINKLGENSVGRWKTEAFAESRKKGTIDIKRAENRPSENTAHPFSEFTSISQAKNDVGIPRELSESVDHESGLFILASERESHQYIEAIDKSFPLAKKFGVLGASTPFINGLSSTIYQEDKTHTEGIVGVYLRPTKHTNLELDYPEMTPIGPPMKITKCRGNIILGLDDDNATGTLLSQLNKFTGNKIQKDEELYISLQSLNNRQAIYRIESGDPSKGAMAVSTSLDLPLGATVQVALFQSQKIHMSSSS